MRCTYSLMEWTDKEKEEALWSIIIEILSKRFSSSLNIIYVFLFVMKVVIIETCILSHIILTHIIMSSGGKAFFMVLKPILSLINYWALLSYSWLLKEFFCILSYVGYSLYIIHVPVCNESGHNWNMYTSLCRWQFVHYTCSCL